MTPLLRCPGCGGVVTVAGDDAEGTHYYVPEREAGPDDVRCVVCGGKDGEDDGGEAADMRVGYW